MAKFFIHRPIFAIVLVGILAGLISPPTGSVSTTYTGTNPSATNNVNQLQGGGVRG